VSAAHRVRGDTGARRGGGPRRAPGPPARRAGGHPPRARVRRRRLDGPLRGDHRGARRHPGGHRPGQAVAQLRDGGRDVGGPRPGVRRPRRAHARRPPGSARADPRHARGRARGRRRGLRPADRPRREPRQARPRDALLPDDGAPGPDPVPGAGGRLPAHDPPRRRDGARDARAPPLPARDGGVGRLQPGADRVPAGRPRRRPGRLLPPARAARGGGGHLVLRRPARARHLPRARGGRGVERRRDPHRRRDAGGLARAGPRGVDADGDPLPRRRAARVGRDPRALRGARPRADAAKAALPRRRGRAIGGRGAVARAPALAL
ncbi:MAG: hypothetical protein AVDCRST_MAG30-1994, partial [uncultured Solirubrobacteraceae bacterium]